MALTLEQESALLALLNEKRTTLPELSAATEVTNSDLLLINQMLADKSVTADVLKRFIAPEASTEQAGVVQLSNRIDSDSDTTAATSRAVKVAKDSVLSRSANLADVQDVSEALQNLGILNATIDNLGLVKLNDKIDSSSTIEAATPSAIKIVNDKFTNSINSFKADLASNVNTVNVVASNVIRARGRNAVTRINGIIADDNGDININIPQPIPLRFGYVGTYVLAKMTAAASPGGYIAGSNLYAVSATANTDKTTSLTGTWICCGYGTVGSVTLFLRAS